MKLFLQFLKTAVALLIVLTFCTGILYPAIVTGCAQLFFSRHANGHWLYQNSNRIGEAHIGQLFTDPKYFWGRPSATSDFPYNALQSSGSNLGPSNPLLATHIKERIAQLKRHDATNHAVIPMDLITSSGSGLDPDISVLAAFYQVPRIARARRLSEKMIQECILMATQQRTLKLLGEPRVNVLRLNLLLDTMKEHHV